MDSEGMDGRRARAGETGRDEPGDDDGEARRLETARIRRAGTSQYEPETLGSMGCPRGDKSGGERKEEHTARSRPRRAHARFNAEFGLQGMLKGRLVLKQSWRDHQNGRRRRRARRARRVPAALTRRPRAARALHAHLVAKLPVERFKDMAELRVGLGRLLGRRFCGARLAAGRRASRPRRPRPAR